MPISHLVTQPAVTPRRPHQWWLLVAVVCVVVAVVAATVAIAVQREASRPVGEGELFAQDATFAMGLIESAPESESVRLARNELEVEAVSVVDTEGMIVASTSENLVGTQVTNPLLRFGMSSGRLVALAGPIESPVLVDRVVQWEPGEILYQVASPLPEEGAVILLYDIEELLSRRARSAGLQSETAQLLGAAGLFALISVMVYLGYTRAARRHQEIVTESDTLRRHAVELSKANLELAEARSKAEGALALAEEKIRIRSDFVLMINHELRTPLTSVVTGARLLKDLSLSRAERDQVIEAIIEDGTRLGEIIDQILVVARIENRGLDYQLEEVRLDDLLGSIKGAQHAPDCQCRPEVAMVRTDLRALAHVVSSLSDNARTHGASQVTVRCGTESAILPAVEVGQRPEHALFVTITDDGPGISPEFLPRIFEKFEKSSFSPGTGLGLYLVRLMVEALQGSVGVQTGPNGTTFQIALPLVATSQMVMR